MQLFKDGTVFWPNMVSFMNILRKHVMDHAPNYGNWDVIGRNLGSIIVKGVFGIWRIQFTADA